MLTNTTSPQRGALLLEATLALLLFAVGLLLLARASCVAAQADGRLRRSASLQRALESKLEELRARPYDALAAGADRFSDTPGLIIERHWTKQDLWPGFAWIEVQVRTEAAAAPSYRSASGRRR